MHKEKGSGRALGLDPFFRNSLYFLFFNFIFVYKILILYTTDFNPRINKDIIIIVIIIIIIIFGIHSKEVSLAESGRSKVQKSLCCGVVVITTAQLRSTKPEQVLSRFKSCLQCVGDLRW